MKKGLKYSAIAVILAVVILLGACSSAATTTTPQVTTTTTTTTTTPKITKLNVALKGSLTTLDWATNGGGQEAAYDVFEPLLDFDTNQQLIGCLAESWQVAGDGKSISMKLKEGIVFSTGDPLTTADVQFTLERVASAPSPTGAQLAPNVFSGVTIIDDLNMVFNFPVVNTQFLTQTLTNCLIESKAQFDRLGNDEFVKQTAGTGPYKFVEYQEGQYVDLAYNDKYRGPKPQITDVHIVYTADDATRINQLESGEVDMAWDLPTGSIADVVAKGFQRIDVVQPHDICLQFAYVDTTVPWADVNVRKAISYAIDRDKLNDTLFGGVYQKAVWLESWELGYDPSLDPAYPYNIAEAQRLMDVAGYSDGFDMTVYYPTFMSWAKNLVEYLTGTLSQIGITVKPVPLSDFPAVIGYWQSMHANDGQMATGVLVMDVGWPGNPIPVINLTNGFAYSIKDNVLFVDAVLDQIITQLLTTLDPVAQEQLIRQAYEIINDTLPFVPILLEVTCTGAKSDLIYTPSHGGMNAGPMNFFDITT